MSRSTADAQRTRIVPVAVEEFAHSGYHATPVTQVALAADVSAAYVFRLFGGKLGLFVAAVDHCYDRVAAAMVAGGETVAPAPAQQVLDAMTTAYVELIRDRALMMLQVHAQSACDIPEIEEAVRRGIQGVVRAVTHGSGADSVAVQRFIAYGQLCHLIVQADLLSVDEDWANTVSAGIRHPDGPSLP